MRRWTLTVLRVAHRDEPSLVTWDMILCFQEASSSANVIARVFMIGVQVVFLLVLRRLAQTLREMPGSAKSQGFFGRARYLLTSLVRG